MSTPSASPYSRQSPFPGKLLTNRPLSKPGSGKEIRHYEICLKGSGLLYEVGDALGIFPTNDPVLVEEIISTMGATGDEMVFGAGGESIPFRVALLRDYHITQPSNEFLQALAARVEGESVVKELLADPLRKADLQKFIYGMETIDFLITHPSVHFTPAELISLLRKLQPRLYSISSSPKAHPDEVHLTISTVRYESRGRKRHGICSAFLADRVGQNGTVPLFFHTAKHFRLPADPSTPIIMVGPGTGIAPFRAYLEERLAIGAPGKNWLFFGDQRASLDYLYQEQLEGWHKDGFLTHLHTAFSRDQTEKFYVQHRMLENAGELWKWLEEGAHFFVCGDAQRMAKDVDAALHQSIEKAGGKTPTEAAQYVENMKKAKRYKRDVY